MNGDGLSMTFAYDGQLPLQATLSGDVAGDVAQTYNDDFRVIQRSINGGNTIGFSYDADNLLIQSGALSMTRDAVNGFITATALGNARDTRDIDSFGQLQSYNASYGGTALFNTTYVRDKLGRIIQLNEEVEGVSHTYLYSYDDAGRLSGVTRDGTAIGNYTYDANGNRLNGAATYDDQDRLLTFDSAAYTYTANGELLTKTKDGNITNYSYDLFGNLKQVLLPDATKIDYLVDGLNRRVGKKVGATLVQGFLYKDSLNPIAELDGSNTIVSRFVYASKVNTPDYMIKGGITYRIISDYLGSIRLVVNTADGSIKQRMDYDVWGNVINDTNPGFQPFGFAGGLYDAQTGLTRFGARDYDAGSGRWTAKDPIGFAGGDSNLYTYASNNPLNFTDVTGKACDGIIPQNYGQDLSKLYNLLQEQNGLERSNHALEAMLGLRELTNTERNLDRAIGIIGSSGGPSPSITADAGARIIGDLINKPRMEQQLKEKYRINRQRLDTVNTEIDALEELMRMARQACPCIYSRDYY